MSAREIFAYCLDCREIHYGISDKNGVYSKDSSSSNHKGHNIHIFDVPNKYPIPIRNVLTKLKALAPITHNEIVLFKIAIDLEGLEKREV